MPEMTSRERFLTALTGGVPDRVPIFDFLFDQSLYEHVIGRRPETLNVPDVVDLSFALGLDAVYAGAGAPHGYADARLSEQYLRWRVGHDVPEGPGRLADRRAGRIPDRQPRGLARLRHPRPVREGSDGAGRGRAATARRPARGAGLDRRTLHPGRGS